jgi:hypothetical protein
MKKYEYCSGYIVLPHSRMLTVKSLQDIRLFVLYTL